MALPNLSILKTGKARAIRFSTLDAICEALVIWDAGARYIMVLLGSIMGTLAPLAHDACGTCWRTHRQLQWNSFLGMDAPHATSHGSFFTRSVRARITEPFPTPRPVERRAAFGVRLRN